MGGEENLQGVSWGNLYSEACVTATFSPYALILAEVYLFVL